MLETAACCEKTSVVAAAASRPACVLPSLRHVADIFKVEYSWFVHFFTDSGGMCVSSPALSLEGALKSEAAEQGAAQPAPDPHFHLDPWRSSIRRHSLQHACDTLELVLLLRALQIYVPVSISFCRSTPCLERRYRHQHQSCHSGNWRRWERLVGLRQPGGCVQGALLLTSAILRVRGSLQSAGKG